MNATTFLTALELPDSATVDQRVPKKLLLEHGAPTAADRRRVTDTVTELHWAAALKPTTVGIAVFRDERREYLEIAVLTALLTPTRIPARTIALVHRAIPYPTLLLTERPGSDTLLVSLARLRRSAAEHDATVLDGSVFLAEIDDTTPWWPNFRESIALARQPRTSLLAVYDGWIDALVAYRAAGLTSTFQLAGTSAGVETRRERLERCARLELDLARARKAAAKTKQLARQIELNLEVQRLTQALEAERAAL